MIALDEYDMKEIRAIEQSLIDAYISQDEEEDVDVFVNNNAPKIFLDYLKDYRAARKELREQGIFA